MRRAGDAMSDLPAMLAVALERGPNANGRCNSIGAARRPVRVNRANALDGSFVGETKRTPSVAGMVARRKVGMALRPTPETKSCPAIRCRARRSADCGTAGKELPRRRHSRRTREIPLKKTFITC